MERENIIPTLIVFVLIIAALFFGTNHVSKVNACKSKGGELVSVTFGGYMCVKELK
jgi:hypothetical protein